MDGSHGMRGTVTSSWLRSSVCALVAIGSTLKRQEWGRKWEPWVGGIERSCLPWMGLMDCDWVDRNCLPWMGARYGLRGGGQKAPAVDGG